MTSTTAAANPLRCVRAAVETCLWAVGVLALSYCVCALTETYYYQNAESRRFDQALARERNAKLPQVAADNAGLLRDDGRYLAHGDVVGRIQIKRLGLSAMVIDGVKDAVLQRAVGHLPGTAFPGDRGNVVLAGHRDTFFRPLRNIELSDEIKVTTLRGSYRYRVASTSVVDPQDVSVVRSTAGESLTLVTCYPFNFIGSAPKRFIVRANRVSG